MTDRQFNALVQKYISKKSKIEELKKNLDEIHNAIEGEMLKREKEVETTTDGLKVTYKVVSTTKLDSKKLKAEMPQVAEKYSYKTEGYRLTVTTSSKATASAEKTA